MALTPREIKALAAIEASLAVQDPGLVRKMAGKSRLDWEKPLKPLLGVRMFRVSGALLLLLGPMALTFLPTAIGVTVGFLGYLALVPLVVARSRIRPFYFPRLKKAKKVLSDER